MNRLQRKSLSDGLYVVGREKTLASVFAGTPPPGFVNRFHITNDVTGFKREFGFILCEEQNGMFINTCGPTAIMNETKINKTNLLGSHIKLLHAEVFLVRTV